MGALTVCLIFFFFFEGCNSLKCYSCIGFDVANQELQNGLQDEMNKLPSSLPQSNDVKCLATPQDTKSISCNSLCVSVVGFVNTENFGADTLEFLYDVLNKNDIELGQDELNVTAEFVQGLGPVKVAFHSCLDNLIQAIDMSPEDIKLPDITDELPDSPACVTASGEAVGIKGNGQVCVCKTDHCNHMQIKENGPAEAVDTTIDDNDFQRGCPSKKHHNDNNYQQLDCSDSDPQCPNENQCEGGNDRICCPMHRCKTGFNHYCRRASYLRSFKTLNCTEVILSNKRLQDQFDTVKKDLTEIADHRIPPFGKCANPSKAAEVQDCKTGAIFADVFASLKNFQGPSNQLPKELYDAIGVKKLNDLGEASVIIRGCVDKIMPEVLHQNIPKLPELKMCGDVVAEIYGALVVTKGCICNTPNCNDQAGAKAQERALQYQPAEERQADDPGSGSGGGGKGGGGLGANGGGKAGDEGAGGRGDQQKKSANKHGTIDMIALVVVVTGFMQIML